MENERFIAASTQCFVYIFFSSDGIMCSIYVNYNIAVMALVCVISFHFARKGLCLVILNINRRQVANCFIVFDGLVQLLPFKIKGKKKGRLLFAIFSPPGNPLRLANFRSLTPFHLLSFLSGEAGDKRIYVST